MGKTIGEIMIAFVMPGPTEMIIIGVVGVLLFGTRLPRIARSLGGAIPAFKQGLDDVNGELNEIKKEVEK
jgi:sec-independent protein translocase protein TatA